MTDLRDMDFNITENLFQLTVDRATGTYTLLGGPANQVTSVPNYSTDAVAFRQVIDALKSLGFAVERRGKLAGRSTLYWARLLDNNDQEIGSSGGWYYSEPAAVCHAAIRRIGPSIAASKRSRATRPAKKPVVAIPGENRARTFAKIASS